MKKRNWILIVIIAIAGFFVLTAQSCMEGETQEPDSTTGVQKVTAAVEVQSSGMTVEQENIKRRLEAENMPGAIKHLYIISAYSGQVIMYSTVQGKVTSSGKRLTPYSVHVQDGEYVDSDYRGFPVDFGNSVKRRTGEVLQDDGTYGSSISYLYWWDVQDRYHQHYVSGGQIVHVSDAPLPGVTGIIINVEQQ